MRFLRPASRALSHLLRHDPVHYSSPASLFSRHSPFAPLSRAFDDPFFSSPFSAPFYTVYEVRNDDSHNTATNNSSNNSNKAEQQQHNQQEEVKAVESPQQQQRSNDNRLARHSDGHRQRWLDRQSNRRHRHHHNPLSLFSPLDSLFTSPFFASSAHQPLEISVDLYSTPTAYQVNAAIPGVKKEDIKLTVEDGVLTIEAERREERGRPAKATSAPASSSTSSTASTSTDATAELTQQQGEQKTVEVEVKADNVDSKLVPETKAQETQPQHQAGEEEDMNVHHVESYYGHVQRSLALPDNVNVEGLTAKYEDGVLKIELPRMEEKKQHVKQINIQ